MSQDLAHWEPVWYVGGKARKLVWQVQRTKWRIIGIESEGAGRGWSILGLIAHVFYFECNWTLWESLGTELWQGLIYILQNSFQLLSGKLTIGKVRSEAFDHLGIFCSDLGLWFSVCSWPSVVVQEETVRAVYLYLFLKIKLY